MCVASFFAPTIGAAPLSLSMDCNRSSLQAFPLLSQVMDKNWVVLGKVSPIPASNPPPMEAPQCHHPVAHLQEEVVLDEDRTIMCKDSTPTDASTCWQSGNSVHSGISDTSWTRASQTSELVTITYLMEKNLTTFGGRGWGGGGRWLLKAKLWVFGLQFLNIFLSLTHQHK